MQPAKRFRHKATALAAAVLALASALTATSCASVERYYLDNIDTKYKTVRSLIEKTPPDTCVRVAKIEDFEIPGPAGPIPARVYVPKRIREGAPLVLYIHGGGFVIGSYKEVDKVTRSLASGGECIVVSINYALAPEHPYPAALRDCEAAFEWLESQAREYSSTPGRIVLAGESAGGTLSAVLSQKRRDEGKSMPLAQMLFSPAVGSYDPATGELWPSISENAKRSVLTPRSLKAFSEFYLGDPAKYADDPYVNPIMAKSLAGLPRALVVSCGKDTLRDQDEAYAKMLGEAGVQVTARLFPDRDHAYQGKQVLALAVDFLKSL
jgi:acetyl esterase